MKQRSAQAVVLFAMDLEEHHGPFPIEAARQSFLNDEFWQPTRRYLEQLAATSDWGEVIVAANLCFEPVVGTLVRRELGIRTAAANGDTVTPVLARAATQEWEWARAWTTALTRFLLEDELHGAANREVITGWLQEWQPRAMDAALALQAVAPVAVDVERIRTYAESVLVQAGLVVQGDGGGAALTRPADRRSRRVRPTQTRPRPARPQPASGSAEPAGASGNTEPAAAGGTYDFVGIVMAKSAEGDAVAEILGRRDEIEVIEQPAFWDIRASDRLVIPYEEVSEALGYRIDAYSIQHEMSTHYGRMVAGDDALMLFSDPTEAMGYLMS
jgi:hypothetical protein